MSSPTPPPPPGPVVVVHQYPSKTPGTAALVLSILGFCGITAILGIILGFTSRAEAKRLGLSTAKGTAAIIIGLLWIAPVAIGMTVAAFSNTSPSNTSTPGPVASSASSPAPISQEELVSGAWIVCKEHVVDRLKSPDSAEFPPYTSSDITTRVTGDVVGIVSWVEAENSLGARIRTPFSCSASYQSATDSYTVLSELGEADLPTAAGANADQQTEVLALLRKRGFTCTGPQGAEKLYQCRKGTVTVPTYGKQPKELVNVRTNASGLGLDGYASRATIKALKKYGAQGYGSPENGALMFDNQQ